MSYGAGSGVMFLYFSRVQRLVGFQILVSVLFASITFLWICVFHYDSSIMRKASQLSDNQEQCEVSSFLDYQNILDLKFLCFPKPESCAREMFVLERK